MILTPEQMTEIAYALEWDTRALDDSEKIDFAQTLRAYVDVARLSAEGKWLPAHIQARKLLGMK